MTKNIIKFKSNEPIEIKLESDSILEKGYGLISRDIMRDKNISLGAKSIYCYLNSFAGSKGICYPSLELIRNEMGLSKNTLNKYMKELKQSGLIKVFRLQNEDNNLLSNNIYEIAMNYSTIEQNKKEYLNNIDIPSSKSKNLTTNNIPQKKDIVQQLINSKVFTLEEVTSMPIEKQLQAYDLLQKIRG